MAMVLHFLARFAILLMTVGLAAVVVLVCVYTVRHYWFTVNRLFASQRHPYLDVQTADWPTVAVLIPAHNEEAVIAHAIEALLEADYPHDRMVIVPVDDRSTDRTRELVAELAARHPERIRPFYRDSGKAGKAAALKDATGQVPGEILLVFDADYIPGTGLVKQLVAPFFDPEVGATMGRVVPVNVGINLLTRLLDLERAGGYQVDQQARMNMQLVPQFGGTVGGVRRRALESVGGWRDDTLTEDTELTYRLLLGGWQTVYQNRSECYEEVPELWRVRQRQIQRWARGHNGVMWRYAVPLLRNRGRVTRAQQLDGLLLLGVFAMAPLLILGWALALGLLYAGASPLHGVVAILALAGYSTLGNYAAFFQVATAARLDGTHGRIRLLPFLSFGFLVSLLSVSRAILPRTLWPFGRRGLVWHKTQRFRNGNGNGNGH
ncbi:MAG TPA: glycosyltransferase [Gemmatimonadaceae bacterium]|nr:glycosyltransferase [Gemmatimonadaceae bacterium]